MKQVMLVPSSAGIRLPSTALVRNQAQPSTLNLEPSTLNPQPSTLNPQPPTLNAQLQLNSNHHI